MSKQKTIQVKLVGSPIGRPQSQKLNIKALGLKRLNQVVTLPETPPILGLLKKVAHLVEVQDS